MQQRVVRSLVDPKTRWNPHSDESRRRVPRRSSISLLKPSVSAVARIRLFSSSRRPSKLGSPLETLPAARKSSRLSRGNSLHYAQVEAITDRKPCAKELHRADHAKQTSKTCSCRRDCGLV